MIEDGNSVLKLKYSKNYKIKYRRKQPADRH